MDHHNTGLSRSHAVRAVSARLARQAATPSALDRLADAELHLGHVAQAELLAHRAEALREVAT
jgi:cellobiose-specific phosphotransferase system component IIA